MTIAPHKNRMEFLPRDFARLPGDIVNGLRENKKLAINPSRIGLALAVRKARHAALAFFHPLLHCIFERFPFLILNCQC